MKTTQEVCNCVLSEQGKSYTLHTWAEILKDSLFPYGVTTRQTAHIFKVLKHKRLLRVKKESNPIRYAFYNT